MNLINYYLQLPQMSEIRSNSSHTFSAIQFGSKSLNPLESIHPSILNKIRRQADSYLGCSQKCTKIWDALTKNDMAGSHMTENVIEVVFKQFQSDLSLYTKATSLREFMRVFDQDRDGCLNVDEQIQIFSFIKERLELVANNCLQIQEYVRFQNLMKEVRSLETLIAKWQEILRSKVHRSQIQQYRKEGENAIDQFCNQFYQDYENLQKTKLNRRQNFQKQAYYQTENLEEQLNNPNEYIKIKPTNRLKELQFQEKLVSLEERVYEALDFRRELSELEIKEKQRVDHLMQEQANHKRINLRAKQQKQRRELEQKLQELENKLIIKTKKDFEVLRKKNNLHELEIRRLQELERQWGQKKGLYEPELKRTKKLQKQKNQILSEYRRTVQSGSKIQPDEELEGKATMNKFNSKSILSNTLNFKLTNKSQSEFPVNSKGLKINENKGGAIQKYIAPKGKERAFSICNLYNKDLTEKAEKPVVNQEILDKEKSRKYSFLISKLF